MFSGCSSHRRAVRCPFVLNPRFSDRTIVEVWKKTTAAFYKALGDGINTNNKQESLSSQRSGQVWICVVIFSDRTVPNLGRKEISHGRFTNLF